MKRVLTTAVLLTLVMAGMSAAPCLALTERALSYRKANGLVEYSVPREFLSGFFVANETEPRYVFGPVSRLVKACSGRKTWLIEEGELRRVEDAEKEADPRPLEFTVYLESDSPGKTVYYVFVAQRNPDSDNWMKWRWLFHKSKAEAEYRQTRDRLDHAVDEGVRLSGELRFLVVDGRLDTENPESAILRDLKLTPFYDLEKGRRLVH